MIVNMVNADTGEVEVREVDINNPESITNFVTETRGTHNLSDEDTEKLIESIFSTVSSSIVGEA